MNTLKTLDRTVLNIKLKKLLQYPLSFASAPSGFGKTTALRSYLNNQDIITIWFSMYAQQDEQWAWAKIIKMVQQHYPKIDLVSGIPNTRNALDAFIEMLQPHINKPLFIILDDVNMEDIPTILEVFSIYSHTSIPKLHFMVITKNTLDEIAKHHFSNDIFLLNSTDFAFTKEEAFHLCHLAQIDLPEIEIETLYEYTHGWILAFTLMLKSYKTYHNLHYQADINILIRRVFFDSLSIDIQNDFIKLSVLKSFTLRFASKICDNNKTLQVLIKLEKENYFVQTIDFKTYQFIPMFKEFLIKRLYSSTLKVEELNKKIGHLYLEDEELLEALEIFFQIRDYDSIINVFLQYPDIGFANIAPQLMIKIFQTLPDNYKNEYPYIYLKWITDCITNFPQINSKALLLDFKNRVDMKLIQEDVNLMYGEYYFIHSFLYFNDTQKMMNDFKKSYEYFNGRHTSFANPFMITSFGSCHMLFLYYNKISHLEETLSSIEHNIHYFISITNGVHSGSESLVRAEYLYETGQYDNVQLYAEAAYTKAMNNNQLSSAICCLFLMGRLALMQGNEPELKRVKQRLQNSYESSNILILHHEIDCALGYLNILNDDYQSVKSWLKEGSFNDVYLLPEANMIAYIIHGICLIKDHNCIQLKNLYELMMEANKRTPFVLADIYGKLFKTIYLCELGKIKSALEELHETIELCSHDSIISPILELSFAFDYLLKSYISTSYFDKKVIAAIEKYNKNRSTKTSPSIRLTPKEIEVLELCSQGMKVKDIAKEKYVSVNTIQTHMKSIYKKLSISSKLEAVQYYNNNYK